MSKITNKEPTGSSNNGHRQTPAVKYQPKAQRSYFELGIGSICISGADTWGKYRLLELGLAPGMSTPRHTHTRQEAYFVLSGELEVIVGDASVQRHHQQLFKMSSIGQSTTETISKTQSFRGHKFGPQCEWENADTPTRRHADTPIRRHVDTPTRRHADTPTRYISSLSALLALPAMSALIATRGPQPRTPDLITNLFGSR
jgi:mannose-6-phosphate isomerase-like protein (cupin superfamily)